MEKVRVTVAVAAVLRAFLEDVEQDRYGYELMQKTGFPSGKLYPILARLERAGWLERVEPIRADQSGGPARVTYRISPDALSTVRQEVACVAQLVSGSQSQRRFSSRLKWAGGEA